VNLTLTGTPTPYMRPPAQRVVIDLAKDRLVKFNYLKICSKKRIFMVIKFVQIVV